MRIDPSARTKAKPSCPPLKHIGTLNKLVLLKTDQPFTVPGETRRLVKLAVWSFCVTDLKQRHLPGADEPNQDCVNSFGFNVTDIHVFVKVSDSGFKFSIFTINKKAVAPVMLSVQSDESIKCSSYFLQQKSETVP